MSKFVKGTAKVEDYAIVEDAVKALGWRLEGVSQEGIRVRVMDEHARYRPFIDVSIADGIATLTYDHWMGLGGEQGTMNYDTDHDEATTRLIAMFKQACSMKQVERQVKKVHKGAKLQWATGKNGSQVLVIAKR